MHFEILPVCVVQRNYIYTIEGMMQYKRNINLLPYNTFGIEAMATHFFTARTSADVEAIIRSPGFSDLSADMSRMLVLGQGSNILFRGDYDGVIIKNEIGGITVTGEDEEHLYVEVGAGLEWDHLVEYTVDKGWGGLENMTLIPGTVGAAPVQNIGAYGAEASDVIVSVRAYDVCRREWLTMANSDCGFSYRDSIFKREMKGMTVICSVVFRLSRRPVIRTGYKILDDELLRRGITSPGISDISTVVADIRRSRLPDHTRLGNAGSFFKNPVVDRSVFERLSSDYPGLVSNRTGEDYKIYAGWLIEKTGWKGVRKGNVGCYDKQALVIVNFGGATGEEVYAFSEEIIDSVIALTGITLEREVNVV